MPNIKDYLPTPVHPPKTYEVTAEELKAPTPTQAQLRALLRKATNSVADYASVKQMIGRLIEEASFGNQGAAKIVIELLRGTSEDETADTLTKAILTPTELDAKLRAMGYVKADA